MTRFTQESRAAAIRMLQAFDGMDAGLVITSLCIALGSAIGAHSHDLASSLEDCAEKIEAAARAHPMQRAKQ